MKSKNTSEFSKRMWDLRSKYETVIPSNDYVVAMIDGRGFSHYIKNKYKRPFDDKFVDIMNYTAISVAKDFGTCIFAYVQSDEITFVFKPTEDPVFGNRLSKLSSLISSCATGAFNQREMQYDLDKIISDLTIMCSDTVNHILPLDTVKDMLNEVKEKKPRQFDCKIFSCSLIDVYSFLLWRQLDCVRNSKQQTAQTYIPHKALLNKNCDVQVEMLKEQYDVDWNTFDPELKYGRFIYKETELFRSEQFGEYMRSVFKVHGGFLLNEGDGREKIISLLEDLSKNNE